MATSFAGLKYRRDIDGLRAVAVLPVLFFHAGLGFTGGYVGVDVFFVISGFLITRIIYDEMSAGSFTYRDFYDRRIRRLFPPLFVVLIATTIWALAVLIWVDLESYARSLFSAILYLSNINFYLETGYFTEAAHNKPLLHTWSLAVEEQFYIAVPLLLAAFVRWVPRRLHVPALAILSAASFVFCVWLTGVDTSAAFYLIPARAWELGLGGVIALSTLTGRATRWRAELLTLAGLGAIFYAIFAFTSATPFPGWRAAIPVLGTAAILAMGHYPGTLVNRLLTASPAVFVGKISYSLYLWHWPVLVMLFYGRDQELGGPRAWLGLLLSFVLATLSWRLIEQPFRLRRWLGTTKGLFAGAAIGSVLLAGSGLALYAAKGLPQRHEETAGLLDPDRWLHDRRECHGRSPEKIAAGDLCVRGRAGVAPSFVLAGDSHADALSPAVFAAADRLGMSGYQATAASFIPVIGRSSLTSDVTPATVSAFVSWLKARPEIGTVLVTGFWSLQSTGESYRHQGQIYVDDLYDGTGTAYNPRALANGFDRLVREFPDRQFIFLDDIPTGRNIHLTEYVRQWHVSGRRPEGTISRAEIEAQQASYEPIFRQLARRHANVRYAPVLVDSLCGERRCPLFAASGEPIYRDGDHLSAGGALALAPRLLPILSSAGR